MAGALSTSFGTAEHSPGLQLWLVTNAWQAAMRRALVPHGLTHVQFVLLASLVWIDADGPVTQKALADQTGTDPMMTSQVLRALEAKGLVERHPHPEDSRARSLVATPAGVALANTANESVEAADRTFFAPLETGLAGFADQLARLVRARG